MYGGGRVGLMGEIARAARIAGSRTVGIITTTLVDRELADPDCDELIVVETMRERKRLLAERGDGFVVLPGGIGTYEEFFEILVGRKLLEHDKPIACVCHGVEILAAAGCVKGRRMATVPKCRFDLEVAGGIFVNEPCVVDGNLVSGRTYHDHGKYMGVWMKMLNEARQGQR